MVTISSDIFKLYKDHPIKSYQDEDRYKKKCFIYEKKFKGLILKNLEKKGKSDFFFNSLLDPWINLYVESVFLKYLLIKKKKKVVLKNFNLYFPEIENCEKFGYLIQKSEGFNQHLIKDIAEFFNIKVELKNKTYFKEKISKDKKIISLKLKEHIRKKFSKFFYKVSNITDKPNIILDNIFHFRDELSIILKNKFLYKIIQLQEFKKEINSFDLSIKNSFKQDEFLNLLTYLSKKYFPDKIKSILSNISDIEEYKKKAKKNILVTRNLSSINEDYRIFVAQNNKNLRIFSVQHGGGYGHIKNFYLQKFETENSQFFLSWGWKNRNPKIKPLALKKENIFEQEKNENKDKKILFVGSNYCLYEFRLNTVPIASRVLYNSNFLKNKVKLLNTLRSVGKIIYKPHSANDWYQSLGLKKMNIKIYKGKKNLSQLARENNLIILSSISTSFMEMMSLNKPLLLYLEKNIYRFENNFQNILNEMKKHKILHHDIHSIKKFLSSNKFNTNYWYNNKTQKFIKKFLDLYYLSDKMYVKKFEKIFKKYI